jgi:hypothetical protein
MIGEASGQKKSEERGSAAMAEARENGINTAYENEGSCLKRAETVLRDRGHCSSDDQHSLRI